MFAYFVNKSQITNMNQTSWVRMYNHVKLTVIQFVQPKNSSGSFGLLFSSSSINTAATKPHNMRDASNEDTQLNRRNLSFFCCVLTRARNALRVMSERGQYILLLLLLLLL